MASLSVASLRNDRVGETASELRFGRKHVQQRGLLLTQYKYKEANLRLWKPQSVHHDSFSSPSIH